MRISDWSSDVCSSDLQQLLQLAKKYAMLVVEDAVYAELQNSTRTRLAALDTDVVYVGSFSKTLSSSLRVGLVVAGSYDIRSDERHGGKECVSTWRSRLSP